MLTSKITLQELVAIGESMIKGREFVLTEEAREALVERVESECSYLPQNQETEE